MLVQNWWPNSSVVAQCLSITKSGDQPHTLTFYPPKSRRTIEYEFASFDAALDALEEKLNEHFPGYALVRTVEPEDEDGYVD